MFRQSNHFIFLSQALHEIFQVSLPNSPIAFSIRSGEKEHTKFLETSQIFRQSFKVFAWKEDSRIGGYKRTVADCSQWEKHPHEKESLRQQTSQEPVKEQTSWQENWADFLEISSIIPSNKISKAYSVHTTKTRIAWPFPQRPWLTTNAFHRFTAAHFNL